MGRHAAPAPGDTPAPGREAPTTPAVSVRGLTVRRGGLTALDGVDVDVAAHRITGLLGPSGSGKSTLMRAIVGSQVTHGGTVTVLGRPAGEASLRAEVGYTTQAPSVYPDLTVAENVASTAALFGRGAAAVTRVLAEVGLTDFRRRLSRKLSGGQLHRVSLACALVADPALLVLDEPTVGLDPVLREEIWDGLRARATAGTTILVSSHVMEEATRCDDLVLLREGRVLFTGTPAGLAKRTGTPDLDRAFLRLVRQGAAR